MTGFCRACNVRRRLRFPEMEETRLSALVRVGRTAAKSYGKDEAGRAAAALSFYTLFSLVPMMFLIVAVVGFIFDDVDRVNSIVQQVETAAGEKVSEQIADLLELAKDQAGASLGIGIFLTVFSASGIFLQVQGVLNRIFKVPTERTKGLVAMLWKRGIAFVSAVVLAVLATTPMMAVAVIRYVNRSLVPDDLSWLRTLLAFGVPVVSVLILIGVVGVTFQTMTAVRISWRAARRGGAFTALSGLLAAYLVGAIIGEVGDEGTLGALGGVAILLFFFNLMWQVYLFGAEVTKVYAGELRSGAGEELPLGAEPLLSADTEAPSTNTGLAGIFGLALGFALGRRYRRR